MIGILAITLFLPVLNQKMKYADQKTASVLILKASTSNASGNQSQIPFSINLLEEEIEHVDEITKDFSANSPVHITITFSSSNLFFDQHFSEVSGPPPWA